MIYSLIIVLCFLNLTFAAADSAGEPLDGGVTYQKASDIDLGSYKVANYKLSQFKAPILYDSNNPHLRIFIACIDGTENDKFKDPTTSLTNVATIYEDLASLKVPNIKAEYQPGVGRFSKVDAAFGISMKESIQSMYTKFINQVANWKMIDPNVEVVFMGVGFSNGAMQIAALSGMIHEMGSQDPKNARVIIEVTEDDYRNRMSRVESKVVYSGDPVLNPGSIPQGLVLFSPVATNSPNDLKEANFRLSSSVIAAYLQNARDDRRALFRQYPLLSSEEKRFLETTVAGAHADIGGGSGGKFNGLTILSGNLGRNFLNSMFDRPLLTYIKPPTDPNEFVIHRSEEYYWFYKFSLVDDIEDRFLKINSKPQPVDQKLVKKFKYKQNYDGDKDMTNGIKELIDATSGLPFYEISTLNPALQETIRLSHRGILLSKTSTYLNNMKPYMIETLINNKDGSYSISSSKFNFLMEVITVDNQKFDLYDKNLNSYSTILNNNRNLVNAALGANQFYIDNKLSSWLDVSKSTGLSIDQLLSANPKYSIVSKLLPGTIINLPSVDNTRIPKINVIPDAQPKKEVEHEDQLTNNFHNGYAYNSPTSSIMFSKGELDSSKFVDAQKASLVTGHVRPGSVQLDPNPRPSEYILYNINRLMWYSTINGISLNTLITGSVYQIFIDPIVLDLNGDGVHFTDYKMNGVIFDVDNSGMKTRTGWTSPQDGFLVVDFNMDGVINSIAEMFSEYTNGSKGENNQPGKRPFKDGWSALAKYDTNFDKFIDYNDASIWNLLKVWIDSNHDGKSWIDTNENDLFDVDESTELFSLAELRINLISLDTKQAAVDEIRDGNRLISIGRFLINNSVWMEAIDVDLVTDSTHHLIKAQGNGKLIVSQTAGLNWTQAVKTYLSESYNESPILNATQLGVSNIYGGDGNDTLIALESGSWLTGGGGSNTYKGGAGDDVFVITSLDKQENIDGGAGTNTVIFSGDKPITLNMALANVQIAQAGGSDAVIISGGRTGVYMKGGTGFNTLIGGSGDDVIVGGKGKNLIIGGRGKAIVHAGRDDDLIYGALNDSIIILGGGWDQVFAGSGNDVVKLGTGTASIDGGDGINIVELQGSYAEYKIQKLTPNNITNNSFEYRITDLVPNRNGIALIKRIQILTFDDISAVRLNEPGSMPVPDVLHVNGCLATSNGENIILIPASKILKNDHLLGNVGNLRISSLSDPIGGTVRLTSRNEKFTFKSGQSIKTPAGDVVFICKSLDFSHQRQFKYMVVDRNNIPSIIIENPRSGENAPLRAKVSLVVDQLSSDPLLTQQSYLQDTRIYDAWNYGYSGKGVRIGQFEPGGPFSTGPEIFDYTHPDLAPNIDQTFLQSELRSGELPKLFSNHATNVAGVMVAAKNQIGITGIAYGATLAGYYLANDGADNSGLSRLVNFDIINHSWGLSVDFDLSNINDNSLTVVSSILSSLEYAATNGRAGLGTISVVSAGNSRAIGGSAQGSFIGNNRFSIQVAGAYYLADLSTLMVSSPPFSSRGACILVSAPADEILSTSLRLTNDLGELHGNMFSKSKGTSFSAPIVSASVALIIEANPRLTYRDVQTILAVSAYSINDPNATWSFNGAKNWNGGGMHISHDYGFGHIDTRASVRLAEAWLLNLAVDEKVNIQSWTDVLNLTAPCSVSFAFWGSSYIIIEHVEVDVEFVYSRFGDVSIFLISPTGTQSVLLDRPGKIPQGFPGHSDSDLGDKRFGTLHYTFMSTRHWGEKTTGEWKLKVNDATADNSSVKLIRWSLRMYGRNASVGGDDTYFYTDEYATLLSGNNKRGVLDDSVNGVAGGRNTINAAAVNGDVLINILDGQANISGAQLIIKNSNQIQNLISGDGNDILVAGIQKSLLYAGRGINSLTGGASNDIFVVLAGKGRSQNDLDTIYNFNSSQGDILIIVGLKCQKFTDLLFKKATISTDTLVSWSSLNLSQSILIKNAAVDVFNEKNVILQPRLNVPTSFFMINSKNDSIVTQGTDVIKLNGSMHYVTLTDNRWSLEGVLFKRDMNSIKTRFVVMPFTKNTLYYGYGNGVLGFAPKVDQIDLSLTGLTRFSEISLVKCIRAEVNKVAIISGTCINARLPNDSPDKITSLVYLDAIDPFQLNERNFLFSTTEALDDLNSDPVCINKCQPRNPCANNGVCFQSKIELNGYYCKCRLGYNGSNCENLISMCSPINPCKNDAICSQTGPNRFTCKCKNGTYGRFCQNVVDKCANYTCFNNGSCVQLKYDQEPICSCRYGFQGQKCETLTPMCEPSNPCANNATCIQTSPGAFICSCVKGFYGTNCEKIINICDFLKPCLNNGTCLQIDENSFNCSCSLGFDGSQCEFRSTTTKTTTRVSSTSSWTSTTRASSNTSRTSTTIASSNTTSSTTTISTTISFPNTNISTTSTTWTTIASSNTSSSTTLTTSTTITSSSTIYSTTRLNFCPQMSPKCFCETSYYIDCNNFSRFEELNFFGLDPFLSNLKNFLKLRLAPTSPLVFNSSLKANRLQIIQNKLIFLSIILENVIGFEIKANPFNWFNFYGYIQIKNSIFAFYNDDKPFSQTDCTSDYFAGFKPFLKNFQNYHFTWPIQFSQIADICPFLMNFTLVNKYVLLYPDRNNNSKLITQSENVNSESVLNVLTNISNNKTISVDQNSIDSRLIRDAIFQSLPSTSTRFDIRFYRAYRLNVHASLFLEKEIFGLNQYPYVNMLIDIN